MEYLLKASAVVVIFYLCYKVFLQRDTFFIQNRSFLLFGLVTAFLLPFLVIPIYIEYAPIEILPNYSFSDIPLATQETEVPFNILDYLPMLYLLGVLTFSIRFLIQVVSLSFVIYRNKKEKHERYTHVKINTNLSPFSFFNWIVYNPNSFTETELEQIITHEKVHANQMHSIDTLLTQLCCITLWFNPFIWLYNKDLKQNLEFIADHETQSKFHCRKSYQTTLLKTSMPSHQMALTNNFYTSLIKKRIVMLHKSKSKKINSIKYAFVIPLLAIFLMSFNTEEVYVESKIAFETNTTSKDVSQLNEPFTFYILDGETNEQIEEMKSHLSSKGYTMEISDLKRNTYGIIIGITLKISNASTSANYSTSSSTPIKPIKVELDSTKNTITIGMTSDKVVMGFPSQEKADDYKNLKKLSKIDRDNQLIILDGKEVAYGTLEKLDTASIKSVHVLKDESATEKYGDKGKNGVIEIITKNTVREIKTTTGKSMKDVEVIGYGDPTFKEGNKTVSKDSILFNKTNDTIARNPWKVGYSANAGNNNNNNNRVIIASADGKDPIYIKDGIEITKKELQELNPNAIESIAVLKGESATEKYGDKGKDGVVEITSKKNNQSQWKVTGKRNTNVIFATKDTIYIKEKQHLLKQLVDSFDQQPLYILDGKEVDAKDITALDEMKVGRIYQIKDSEIAVKKFGEKAKNGVVEITSRTKNSKTPIVKVVGSATYIVDGKKITSAEFDNLQPEDIKTFRVLKGSSTKYGTNTKGSIIEITTKKN